MEYYIAGDWVGASGFFTRTRELYGFVGSKDFGWLRYLIDLMDKTKNQAPEGWNGAYDWDVKPTPPDFEVNDLSESGSGTNESN
jgi:hypothetical protein